MDSGSRQAVLVDKGQGRFEPREVKTRPSRRRIRRGPRGRCRRRVRRRLRELPDRCGKQPEGGAEGLCRRGAAMIARLIAWSARNLLLVLFGTGFAAAGRHLCTGPPAAGRHPGPLRHAGHRLHRIPRPGAAGDRGPGHLSSDDRDADGAEVEGGARVLVLRRLVRLRHLRGRHRHLLGALARARIPQRRGLAAAGRRDADDRPRRYRRRLGLPVRGDVEGAEPGRHARDPGLESEIRAGQGGGRRRGRERRRLRQAVQRRSSIRSGCATSASPCRRCATRSAPAMPTSAAAPSSFPSSNTSSAARATSRASTISATSC